MPPICIGNIGNIFQNGFEKMIAMASKETLVGELYTSD